MAVERGFILACIVGAVLLLLSGSAAADAGRGRVLVLANEEASSGWHEAEKRTRAELRALGFDVVTLTLAGEASLEEVAAFMRTARASVAVRVGRGGPLEAEASPAVEAYAWDVSGEHLVVRRLPPERTERSSSAEQVGLLAAELVYSALARAETRAETASPSAPPAGSSREPPAQRPLVELRGGPWFGGVPARAGPLAGVALGASFWPMGRAGLDVQIDVPVIPVRLTAAEGRASIWIGDQRLHGVVRTPPWHPFGVEAGLGFGGLELVSSGRARPPLEDGVDAAAAVLLSSMLAGSARVGAHLRLLLAGRAALAIPEIRVDFAGREVATLGRPLLDVTLTVAGDLPAPGALRRGASR